MKSRLIVVIAAAAAALIGTLVASQDAQADSPGQCAAGYACIWEDTNYLTNGDPARWYRIQTYVSHLGNKTYNNWGGDIVGDTASSASNNTVDRFYWYVNAQCYGDAMPIDPGVGYPDLNLIGRPGGGTFNQILSSGARDTATAFDNCRTH